MRHDGTTRPGERQVSEQNNKTVPAWKQESPLERAHKCMAYLYFKGFITEREKDRVKARITKAATATHQE